MMNNLKSKVVSPELAKKMANKLGWKKETIFCWVKLITQEIPILCYCDLKNDGQFYQVEDCQMISYFLIENWCYAPFFSEVWEELPKQIECKLEGREKGFYAKYIDEDNVVDYESPMYCCLQCHEYDKVKANSIQENAGCLWCWCRENGYIKEE